MKVYEALARAFTEEGTSAVFGMMGDANMYWMNALDKLGVRLYDVRHEGAGLAMADGWARLNGTPGVCTTTSGPGSAQLATTMLVASRARTPLVAFCGDVNWGDDEDNQRLNQERFAAAIEAGFVRVSSAESAYHAVQKAFYLAKVESRPVILSVPANIQQESFDDDEEYTSSSTLFRASPIWPSPERVREAADIIAESSHPVVVAGRGAVQSGAGEPVLRLADRIGAIVATSLLAKNWLIDADYHVGVSGLYATRTAVQLFQEADCVIAVGASLNIFTTEHGYLYPDARYVQLDTKPHVIMGDGRSADCYVQTDARLGVEALDKVLEERSVHSIGYRTPEVKEQLTTAYDDNAPYEIEDGTVDPREVCLVLDEMIPDDIGLVLGSGQQVRFGTMLLKRPRPFVMAQHHFGCIGQGLTTGMGAAIAGGNPVFVVEGDGGFMMHLAEFETASRYNVPVLVVVMNDEALGAEYHKSVATGLNAELARIATPDLGAVGVSLGGRGALVQTIDDLRGAVAEFVARPGPMLLDVRISRNVLSIPYRRLWYGEDV